MSNHHIKWSWKPCSNILFKEGLWKIKWDRTSRELLKLLHNSVQMYLHLCWWFLISNPISLSRDKRKDVFAHAQNAHPMYALSHPGIWSLFTQPIVSNDSVSRQQRPWSDCANAQSDQGLCCPQRPKTFAHGGCHLFNLTLIPHPTRKLSPTKQKTNLILML